VAAAVVVAGWVHGAAALDTAFTNVRVTGDTPRVLQSFGAAAGAEVAVYLDSVVGDDAADAAVVAVVPLGEWSTALAAATEGGAGARMVLCTLPALARWEVVGDNATHGAAALQTLTTPVSVPLRSQYVVAATYCGNGGLRLSGRVVFRNPSLGPALAHLPLERAALLPLFIVLAIFYALLLAAGCVVAYTYGRPAATRLHAALAGAAFAKLAAMVASAAHHGVVARRGRESSVAYGLAVATDSVQAAVWLATMFSVALGWQLSRRTLTRREVAVLVAATGVLLSLGAIKSACQRDAVGCTVVAMTEYILRAILCLAVVISFNVSLMKLRYRLSDLMWAPSIPGAYALFHMLARLRWAFMASVLLPPLLIVARVSLADWAFEWLNTVVVEGIAAVTVATVAYLLRPQAATDAAVVADTLDYLQRRAAAGSREGLPPAPVAVAVQAGGVAHLDDDGGDAPAGGGAPGGGGGGAEEDSDAMDSANSTRHMRPTPGGGYIASAARMRLRDEPLPTSQSTIADALPPAPPSRARQRRTRRPATPPPLQQSTWAIAPPRAPDAFL